jgi:hypothetical protein
MNPGSYASGRTSNSSQWHQTNQPEGENPTRLWNTTELSLNNSESKHPTYAEFDQVFKCSLHVSQTGTNY